MINAHKVVDYLKEHFNQSDVQIVLLLSQGVLLMKAMMKIEYANIPGFDDDLLQEIDKIDVIEEEFT